MEAQDKLEYNRRCAEFLGWKFTNGDVKIPPHLYEPYNIFEFESGEYMYEYDITSLKFNSDWSWIMEMVEAIEIKFPKHTLQWEYDDREEFAENGKYKAYWFTLYSKEEICSSLTNLRSKSRKEAVVEAINQFLIWYEQNNS